MKYKYSVSKPSLIGKELEYVTEAVKTGWISSSGGYIPKFEEEFSKVHNASFGVACSSGTNALILALRALNINFGDEVIVPEFTMVATAWAVNYVGAKCIFVDCGEDLNINVDKIEQVITSKTKAIIPVHIYGRQCNMEKIKELAFDYNLKIIEDSAEAHGITLSGDIACFSLYANKIITSGEGGICITNDEKLAEQMKHLRGMAFNKEHTFLHKKYAYNFRMTNLQAAVALAQTERLDEIFKKRKQIEKWYDEELKDINGVKLMSPRNVLWMYDILVYNPKGERDRLVEYLKENGVETRVFFKPMSMQPMYKGEYWSLLAYKMSLEGLYLPTYTDITKEEIVEITGLIRKFFNARQSTS